MCADDIYAEGSEAERHSVTGRFKKDPREGLKNGFPVWRHSSGGFYMYAYQVNEKLNTYVWHVSKARDFVQPWQDKYVWATNEGLACPYANGTSWSLSDRPEDQLDLSSFRVTELGKRKNLISVRFGSGVKVR